MKQFLLAEPPDKDGLVRLGGKEYRYLVSVRRLKPGDTFIALPPPAEKGEPKNSGDFANTGDSANSGQLLTVTVLSIENHTLTGSVVQSPVMPDTAEGIPPMILFQGLPREAKMDLIVRQAAETGISEIVPFTTDRSIPKEHFRVERWRRIIKEARQQSGSPIDTRIRPPLTADELFAYWKELSVNSNHLTHFQNSVSFGNGFKKTVQKASFSIKSRVAFPKTEVLEKPHLNPNSSKTGSSLGIVFCPGAAEKSGAKGLEKSGFHRYLSKEPLLTVLAVGPEGGLSAAEIDRFMDAGFKPLSMGSTVLRTETAALYGAAAVRIILMEKAWWMLKQQ